MNETYDLLYSRPEEDFPQTYMQWRIFKSDLSLAEIKDAILDNIQNDVDYDEITYAYRVVRHGEGGNII